MHSNITNDVSGAANLFRMIISNNGMDKFNITGWGDNIILPFMVDPEGWLAVWMLKSDEVAVATIGKRLWDVCYYADDSCFEGIRPVDSTNILDEKEITSYLAVPVDDGASQAVRYAIANSCFIDSLIIEKNSVLVKKIKGFYSLESQLSNGEVLPFPSVDNILAQMLTEMSLGMKRELDRHVELNKGVSDGV